MTGVVQPGTAEAIDVEAAGVPLSPCRSCGALGRWASVKGSGPPVNMLLEADPHPLGMYALLSDGRRAVNLVWAADVDPRGEWLHWGGPRHRDHFTLCSGWSSLRTGREIAKHAVEGIGEDGLSTRESAPRRSRRLRDWP